MSKATGISRAALRSWLDQPEPRRSFSRKATCVRCGEGGSRLEAVADPYSYLLGLYLGDGCLSRARKGVWVLRIACADAWPGLMEECARAMQLVMPYNRVFKVAAQGHHMVQACSKHWLCLFPQHGEGRKHERRIALVPWQAEIVEVHAKSFLRGLFHSDGCRITNWTVKRVAGQPKRYEYPRYLFVNQSSDILGLCAQALDGLGIAYARPKPNTISVARKAAVAAMDEFIGPKH